MRKPPNTELAAATLWDLRPLMRNWAGISQLPGSRYDYHRSDGRGLIIVTPHGRHKTCHPADIRKLSRTLAMKTTHEYRDYVFIITYQAQEPAYVVDFPDIPDIITSGCTLAEAFANACEALDLHLESLQKLSQRLPKAKHRVVVEEVKR